MTTSKQGDRFNMKQAFAWPADYELDDTLNYLIATKAEPWVISIVTLAKRIEMQVEIEREEDREPVAISACGRYTSKVFS